MNSFIMNSQKKIEINQSSLLGLKAELLRKKNEVSSAKYSQELNNVKVIKKKLVTKFDKANEGVSEREQRDAEEVQIEADKQKNSQLILEEKAKLYDQLTNKCLGADSKIDSSNFLVDFKEKAKEEKESAKDLEPETVESDYGDYSEDEDEWIDFIDCLGRTKRCHKDDIQVMKEQDEKLRVSLFGDLRKQDSEKEKEEERQADTGIQLPQLCSEDMKRELLRQKWEEQERNLLDKKNIHYQDVLFSEARTHGVGYYEFSTDESERLRQQEELKKLRRDTEEQQAESQSIAQKKQKQMEERLKAARRRKRERLGLPPEEEPEVSEVKEEEKKPEPPEELRREIRKPGPIRPWDIGKGGTRILTQEEWMEKKRAERPEEFAPPMFPSKRKYQKQKKGESPQAQFIISPPKEWHNVEPVPIVDELKEKEERGRGVEIPPPPTFDMYGPSSVRRRNVYTLTQAEIDKSIEEGLEFLKKKAEAKKAKRPVDEDDIM